MQHLYPESTHWKIRLGYFIPLILLASTPLWSYFDKDNTEALTTLFFIMILAQFVITFKTAHMTSKIMSRLKQVDGNWELPTLTGMGARQIIRGIWKEVMRRTWVDHALLILPRLGLALALMQYLHAPGGGRPVSNILSLYPVPLVHSHPFLYFSHNMGWGHYPILHPDSFQVMLAAILIFMFSLMEGALNVAVSIFWQALMRRQIYIVATLTIISRIALILIVIIIFAFIDIAIHPNITSRSPPFLDYETARCHNPDFKYWAETARELVESGRCPQAIREQTLLRATEATQVTLSSFVDQGALLSANILRPVDPAPLSNDQYGYFGYYRDENRNLRTSYLPFVLRNIASAILAFGLYFLMIWGLLRSAQGILNRRGVAP